MDKFCFVCDVLDYNTGTWWNCDYDTITQYVGYQINVYDELLIDNKQNKNCKRFCMNGSDRVVYMVYILKYIISLITYSFITGK